MCLCPSQPPSMSEASLAMLGSHILNVGQHANHKVSGHGEGEVLISASRTSLSCEWR